MSFYFAWVASTETTFLPEHEREDEKVLSVDLTQVEGEFPSLKIDVENPRVGLLSPYRKQWCWLAYDDSSTGGVTPLFFGRLVGVPQDLQHEVITLEFLARPKDWDTQREVVADAMRVLPYWDPVWFSEEARADPDSVLEGYTRLWHIDRVTHEVTASDVLTGEDGTISVADGFFRDSLAITYNQIPGRRVAVTGEVRWTQEAAGTVDLKQALIEAFRTIGGTTKNHLISSFTGEGLISDWPEKGDGIGAGWVVGESEVTRVDGLVNVLGYQYVTTENGRIASFPLWTMNPTLQVDYEAARSRSETVTFTLETDVQALLTDPGDEETIRLDLQSAEVDQLVDDVGATGGPTMPIGDLGRRSYFQSERGWSSIEHLIARARVRLLVRARSVDVRFEIPWEVGLGLSCRKNVFLQDARLPGGQAAGKIISYSLIADGDSGRRWCQVTIGCTIGQGNTVSASLGTPTYVEIEYVEDGYQALIDRVVMPIAGEVTFTPPEGIAIEDDGVDFDDMRAATVLQVVDATVDEPAINVVFGEAAQRAIIGLGGRDMAAVVTALNVAYTVVRVNLVPLTRGPFEQTYAVVVSNLMVPKTIDLEYDDSTGTGT